MKDLERFYMFHTKPILATPTPKDIRIHALEKESWAIHPRIHPGLVRGYEKSNKLK